MPRAKRSRTAAPAQRVLVLGVEPDAVTRALVALYLEPYGYEVRLSEGVADALKLLPEARATLFVCSEWALAQASGAERERLRDAVAEVPVVALLEPGAVTDWTREWKGVFERLSKPLRADALLSALEGRRRGKGAVPRPGLAGRAGPKPLGGNAQGDAAESILGGFERFIAEVELDAEIVEQLVASFLERSPQYLEDIATGLDTGDLMGVDRAAHTIKGMVGNMHLPGLVELSDRLRLAAKASDAPTARLTLGGLRAAFEEVNTALRARWPGCG